MGDDDVQIMVEEHYKREHRHLVLDGILTLPERENPKKGIVVFAHGSGRAGFLQGISMLLQF